ncbi:unnamed protein product [Ambrosiozyma monospora]|uniref:Unnamed protein product n=1 Tax=Ambrosiozyma monospora TaxID=43982 RepID=A0A9W6YUC2_AMBMO|nr:unnamed protein product [Ambrosiozyma monospora]
MSQIPAPQTLSQKSNQEITEVLNTLFEPCETLTNYLIPKLFPTGQEQYTSYKQIIENSRLLLTQLQQEYTINIPSQPTPAQKSLKQTIDKIVSAHPRLGPPKPTPASQSPSESESLSTHSKSEQASLSTTDPKLAAQLIHLNELYESTFPGLRFVVFVNGRSREEIMKIMNIRIQRNDLKLEIQEAFDAMCDIALDRARKLGAKL